MHVQITKGWRVYLNLVFYFDRTTDILSSFVTFTFFYCVYCFSFMDLIIKCTNNMIIINIMTFVRPIFAICFLATNKI